MAESCAQKILGPWIIGIVILVCTTVLLAFHYSDDLRQVRENRAAVFEKGLQWSGKMGKAKMQPENAGIVSATFTPPWYGKQNPDAVTGEVYVITSLTLHGTRYVSGEPCPT